MENMQEKDILFGASVTVTSENLKEVTSDSFLKTLSDRGCKLVIYVEYVPVSDDSTDLALSDNERDTSLKEALNSNLFRVLRSSDILMDNHKGGCVLFEKRDLVEQKIAELSEIGD